MAFRRRRKDEADPEDAQAAAADLGEDALDGDAEDDDADAGLEPPDGVSIEKSGSSALSSTLDQEPAGELADDPWSRAEKAALEGGPWDADDAPEDKIDRVDLGGIRVPIVPGMELRAEIAEDRVVAATLIIGRSALQIQPFAAPRTRGIWADVREEIAVGIREGGGVATEADGRFGGELIAQVPVQLPEGASGVQEARFLGVDGPRWFLRAVITGEAAVDAAARGPLEDLLTGVIVVRGVDPMAPRDPIELRLPDEVETAAAGTEFDGDGAGAGDGADDAPAKRDADDLKPFERGPEITEIR